MTRTVLVAAAVSIVAATAQPRIEAQALKAKGDARGALEAYKQAAKLEPKAADLQDEIGFLYAVIGKRAEAMPYFDRALELNPAYAPALFHRGVARRIDGALAPAIADLRKAVALAPKQAEYRTRLAAMLHDAGLEKQDLASSRKFFEEAVQLAPGNNDYRNSLGLTLVDLGQAKEGLAQFQAVLKADPQNKAAQVNTGYAHLQTENYDAALEAFRKLANAYPKDAVIAYDLGLALKQKDQLEAAKAAFQKSIELDPKVPEPHYTLGITYWQNNEAEHTASAMREAIALRPDYADAHYMLGTALKQLGELDGAAKALQSAIAFKPESPGPYNMLAQIRQRQGDREAAKQLFAKAAEVKKKLEETQAQRLGTMMPASALPKR